MSFKQIIGQDKPIGVLENALAKNRLAHAYLFEGPAGVGKTLTAFNFAKALNCTNRAEGIVDCCDECASCKKIDAKNHIDVGLIELQKDKSQISIDQIRKMQGLINLKPYEAKYKVFCIIDADFMSSEAQSALLKTLEEPPVKSIIILTTSNTNILFDTIISRCQSIKFLALKIKHITNILAARYNINQDAAYFLSHIAQLGLTDAVALSKADILEQKNIIIDEFESFLDDPMAEPGPLKEAFLREPQVYILWALSVLLWWYRDMLIFKETASTQFLANKDNIDKLKVKMAKYDSVCLGFIINEISKTLQFIQGTNVNAKLAVTAMAVNIAQERQRDV